MSVTITSADLRQALAPQPAVVFVPGPAPHGAVVTVDPSTRYQRFRGVGAAMTDSSAWLMQTQLAPAARTVLYSRLFGSGGIRLGFIRVPMGASDFSATGVPYTYDDLLSGQSDPGLTRFSIAHDLPYVIPALRTALALNPKAQLLAAPWSPPAWMKANGLLSNPADAIGTLLPSAYGPLAQYFVKFLTAYRAAGVPIWAVTPQNEPGQNTAYPGMNLDAAAEGRFITQNLVPALRGGHLGTRVYGYDNNWFGGSFTFADALALNPPVARDLAGIASHCYFGGPDEMAGLHRLAPSLDELVSECSPGPGIAFQTSQLEIAAARNWASAIALWNLALTPSGGPVQPPNYGCLGCTGVVTIDPATHTVRYTRDYYQLGQFSRFIAPGAVRIGANTLVRDHYFYPSGELTTTGVDDVAFQNPDGTRVLVAYAYTSRAASFSVSDGGESFRYRLAPGATATFTWTPRGAS
ncbi:MAG TPA: glycoside hydrolase family 30 beta sandwich domain-containing protein [Solirubrobacteraceae bacterium]|nr:glycoside hydrolase family 30 beta sandwich domain-containing protein [Solirubrobacteraceae bacterium]